MRVCGSTGRLGRIDHPRRPPPDVPVGSTVAVHRYGDVEEYIVGEVVAVEEGRLRVRARDGSGEYVVPPWRVVNVRSK